MKRFIALALITGVACQAENLISNGDFESGYTGFLTDYTLYTGGADPNLCEESEYGVSSAAYNIHPAWTSSGDHTGDGLYFIANGSSNTSKVVWQSSSAISVTQADTAYRFEAYITTVYDVSAGAPSPELTFQVGNGTDWFSLGVSQTFENGYTPGAWRLSFYDGIFSSTGSYFVRLMNSQAALGGNDLGIDDIYFGLSAEAPSIGTNPVGETSGITTAPIPEPASAALLFGGLSLLSLIRRFYSK